MKKKFFAYEMRPLDAAIALLLYKMNPKDCTAPAIASLLGYSCTHIREHMRGMLTRKLLDCSTRTRTHFYSPYNDYKLFTAMEFLGLSNGKEPNEEIEQKLEDLTIKDILNAFHDGGDEDEANQP